MSDLHKGRAVTDAIIAVLVAAGLKTGDGGQPSSGAGWSGAAGQSTFNGYVVVHPMAGGSTDGTIVAADADATPLYQLSAYGATRAQAERLADDAREVMLTTPLVVAGRKVAQVRIDMLGGSARFDGVQPPIWMAVDRYRTVVTSAV